MSATNGSTSVVVVASEGGPSRNTRPESGRTVILIGCNRLD